MPDRSSPTARAFTLVTKSPTRTPAERERRVVVDSSTSRNRCVSSCPLSTSTSGRVVGAGDGAGEESRTVIPISARSALLV